MLLMKCISILNGTQKYFSTGSSRVIENLFVYLLPPTSGHLIDLFTATVFQHASMLECSCHIISYLADVMNALRQSSGQGSSALLMEGEEKALEVDSDWVEELAVEDDDSQAEDSVRIHHF